MNQLSISNLSVSIADKTILNDVSMNFQLGKNYCIVGKNGSGKSSLLLTIMGHPAYTVTSGELRVASENITELDPHERAKLGIFLAFQTIPEIKGVKLFEFLRTIYNARFDTNETFLSFKKIIEPLVEELQIERDFLWRDVNVGFSGGERRKIEILQLKLLQPKYVLLDEVDSWLDVDAFRAVAGLLAAYDGPQVSYIIVTHYFTILDYIPVDEVYLLEAGVVKSHGGVELVYSVRDHGFSV
jgi:Fe-S cluster assembly ATP-binding protein